MVLSARNVGDYLVNRGIIGRDQIVDGEFVATDSTRRNRNFRVALTGTTGYFVKQVADWDPLSLETLEREARFYWRAWNESALQPISRWLPRFHSYEPGRRVLVLELISGGEDLGTHHRRLGQFPETVAAEAGEALARVHETTRSDMGNGSGPASFPDHIPWILTAPDAPAGGLPEGGSLGELLRMVRSYPELSDGVAAARKAWTPETLVHGDLKWENVIVGAEPGDDGAPLRLIDWELVHRGDPAWDVGAMLQAYLNFWVFSMPAATGSKPADLVRAAPWGIESMQPAMRAFWRAYSGARRIEDPDAFLGRSMSYAACRMLQTAYESVQQAPRITPHAVLLLQLSANTLKDPHDATRRLAGI
jgi:hypothetical protein